MSLELSDDLPEPSWPDGLSLRTFEPGEEERVHEANTDAFANHWDFRRATVLLQHAFRDFRARGATRVGLGVDAENTTGAVRLYERVGMQVVRRDDTYEKTL